jgi:pSer/pThr/pTyr-binding forkhead associated (FHA) protein
MPINAKLVVVGGEVKTAEIKLRLPSTIGRGRGCTIMLPQALVSRQHCEIFESGGKLMVRDLGSLNGTFVNNQKIAEASPINSEELLTVGTVTFRVVYEGAGAASPPAGPGPVMKSSANETVPGAKGATASPVVVADPGPPPSNADDNSQPLEIGDFDFEDTARPETTPSKEVAASAKTPGGPLGMPVISVGEPAKKPAAQAAAPVVVSAKPAPAPAAAKATAPPAAKPTAAPAAAPVAAPAAPPAAKAPDAEEKAEEEDDFQDFLKSLGK